jgi:hypothetical protein
MLGIMPFEYLSVSLKPEDLFRFVSQEYAPYRGSVVVD